MPARPVVEARHLGLRDDGGWSFRNFNLTVRPGELVALVGPEDGRSQLLRTLAVLVMPTEGTLRICGHPVPQAADAARAQLVLAQLPAAARSDPSISVRECVEAHLDTSALPADLFEAAAALVGFVADRDAPVSTLAPLQRKGLELALAVTVPIELILIDSVDADLAPEDRATIWSALRAVVRTGIALIAGTAHPTSRADTVVEVPSGSPEPTG